VSIFVATPLLVCCVPELAPRVPAQIFLWFPPNSRPFLLLHFLSHQFLWFAVSLATGPWFPSRRNISLHFSFSYCWIAKMASDRRQSEEGGDRAEPKAKIHVHGPCGKTRYAWEPCRRRVVGSASRDDGRRMHENSKIHQALIQVLHGIDTWAGEGCSQERKTMIVALRRTGRP
jgi:hypothetical protein